MTREASLAARPARTVLRDGAATDGRVQRYSRPQGKHSLTQIKVRRSRQVFYSHVSSRGAVLDGRRIAAIAITTMISLLREKLLEVLKAVVPLVAVVCLLQVTLVQAPLELDRKSTRLNSSH